MLILVRWNIDLNKYRRNTIEYAHEIHKIKVAGVGDYFDGVHSHLQSMKLGMGRSISMSSEYSFMIETPDHQVMNIPLIYHIPCRHKNPKYNCIFVY